MRLTDLRISHCVTVVRGGGGGTPLHRLYEEVSLFCSKIRGKEGEKLEQSNSRWVTRALGAKPRVACTPGDSWCCPSRARHALNYFCCSIFCLLPHGFSSKRENARSIGDVPLDWVWFLPPPPPALKKRYNSGADEEIIPGFKSPAAPYTITWVDPPPAPSGCCVDKSLFRFAFTRSSFSDFSFV